MIIYFGKLSKANSAIYYDFLGENEIVIQKRDKAISTACEGEIYSLAAALAKIKATYIYQNLQTAHLKSPSQINQFGPHTAAAALKLKNKEDITSKIFSLLFIFFLTVDAITFNKLCLLLYLIG